MGKPIPFLQWCGQRDSNPYDLRTQAPQACLSTNSSTAAHEYSVILNIDIVLKKNGFVNPYFTSSI